MAIIPDIVMKIVAIAGPVFAVGFVAAQVPALLEAFRSGTTGPMTPVPLGFVFANSLLWSLYGISIRDASMFIPNALGLLLGLAATAIFSHACQEKKRVLILMAIEFASLASFTLTWVILYFLNNSEGTIYGYIATVFCVCSFGAPITDMPRIFKAKSCASINFPMACVGIINNVCWILYSMGKETPAIDYSVLIANSLGLAFNIWIVILFAIFWKGTAEEKRRMKEEANAKKVAAVATTDAYGMPAQVV